MDIASIKNAFHERALLGLDPEDGPLSSYERCNRTADKQIGVKANAEDHTWWLRRELWRHWYTTGAVERPIEDAALEALATETNPRMKKAETDREQSQRLAKEFEAIWTVRTLKEIHARRGVELQWFDLNLPGAKTSNVISMEVKKTYTRGKRWKDGELIVM